MPARTPRQTGHLAPWAQVLAGLCLAFGAQAEVRYLVTDLGSVPGAPPSGQTVATGLDNRGTVTGYMSPSRGWYAGFYVAGRWHRLGDLPQDSVAQAMNDAGQVAGTVDSGRVASGALPRAFVWERRSLRWLGSLGGGASIARAINASGQVAGMSTTRQGERHAFVSRGETLLDLGTLPGGVFSEAYAVNDRGEVAGFADVGDLRFHAFIWREGVMKDLGTLAGGLHSYAYAINGRGQVAGVSSTGIPRPGGPTAAHAFITGEGDRLIDLGTLTGDAGQSGALALNEAGEVVGWSEAQAGESHAVRVPPRSGGAPGPMEDLNAQIDPQTGWVLNEAVGINARGQIVGNGSLRGRPRAFLLTPLAGAPQPLARTEATPATPH